MKDARGHGIDLLDYVRVVLQMAHEVASDFMGERRERFRNLHFDRLAPRCVEFRSLEYRDEVIVEDAFPYRGRDARGVQRDDVVKDDESARLQKRLRQQKV